MNQALVVERDDRVVRLRMNRPEQRNSLDKELADALLSALSIATQEPNTGCILLEAEGKVFCAGGDSSKGELPAALFCFGASSRVPVVAAVHGAVLGAGMGLILNAHVVIAAQGTSFGCTEIREGGWPDLYWPALVRAIGARRALEVSLTGRVFGTPDAIQYGIAHEAAPAFEFEDRAMATAQLLASRQLEVVRRGLEQAAH